MIKGNETVAAELFEVALAVANEYAKLADLDGGSVLYKENVAVMIFRLHGVARYTQCKVGAFGLFGKSNANLNMVVAFKMNAAACRNTVAEKRNFYHASLLFGRFSMGNGFGLICQNISRQGNAAKIFFI